MPTQQTPAHIIEQEKQTINKLADLASTAEIILNDRGWDSRVYSFNDGRYFFKFPRSEKIQNRYQYEIAAVKFIADLDTDMVTQKILWEHPENAYFGYEGVQGSPVSEIINDLEFSQKQLIGNVVGSFLSQFHKLKLPGARTMMPQDEAEQIQRWYENSSSAVTEFFSDDEQQRLRQLVYEIWPSRLAELGSEPVLCHGDLHFENVLYGDNGKVGIIDFGDVAYYDRSKDFLELENDTVLFEAALKAYGHIDDHLKQKIAVRQAMIQMINLGFFAGKADKAGVELTVAKIKTSL